MTDTGAASFTIEGLDKLQAALKQFPEQTNQLMRAAMQGGGEIVRNEFAVYPPASGANSPPGVDGYRWYERGFGSRTVTGKAYATSEALGRSWNVEVKGIGGDIKAIIGTPVSYAHWVQDRDRQVSFHKARGWATVQDSLDKKRGELETYFRKVIERVVAMVAGRSA